MSQKIRSDATGIALCRDRPTYDDMDIIDLTGGSGEGPASHRDDCSSEHTEAHSVNAFQLGRTDQTTLRLWANDLNTPLGPLQLESCSTVGMTASRPSDVVAGPHSGSAEEDEEGTEDELPTLEDVVRRHRLKRPGEKRAITSD